MRVRTYNVISPWRGMGWLLLAGVLSWFGKIAITFSFWFVRASKRAYNRHLAARGEPLANPNTID